MPERLHLLHGLIEYDAELDYLVTPGGQKDGALRLRWRVCGSRRWRSYLLVPTGEPTWRQVVNSIPEVLERAYREAFA